MKPSTNPKAVATRLRRLHDEAFRDRDLARVNKANARKKAEAVKSRAITREKKGRGRNLFPSGLVDAIKRHHARGRDAGDIAIREGVLVSTVERILEKH